MIPGMMMPIGFVGAGGLVFNTFTMTASTADGSSHGFTLAGSTWDTGFGGFGSTSGALCGDATLTLNSLVTQSSGTSIFIGVSGANRVVDTAGLTKIIIDGTDYLFTTLFADSSGVQQASVSSSGLAFVNGATYTCKLG